MLPTRPTPGAASAPNSLETNDGELPMDDAARWLRADALLLAADRTISLLHRCRPANARDEQQRLLADVRRGGPTRPRFTYRPAPPLAGVRAALGSLVAGLRGPGVLERLYAERALELDSEAALVEARGTPAFAARARARYALDARDECDVARALARRWVALPAEVSQPAPRSCDRHHPGSLVRRMTSEIGRLRLPFRVEVSDDLESIAATGDGVVWIRSGEEVSEVRARRIVHHEVFGHVLPRARATRQRLGLFRVGSARSGEDEEGRATLLEQRAGLWRDGRRRELSLRHLGALAVRDGADFGDCVSLLMRLGSTAPQAVALSCRLLRGGGLCREVAYLPALVRVHRAFRTAPRLESLLERGRLSIAAAREISRSWPAPERDRTACSEPAPPGE
jgi:hypothetical protein